MVNGIVGCLPRNASRASQNTVHKAGFECYIRFSKSKVFISIPKYDMTTDSPGVPNGETQKYSLILVSNYNKIEWRMSLRLYTNSMAHFRSKITDNNEHCRSGWFFFLSRSMYDTFSPNICRNRILVWLKVWNLQLCAPAMLKTICNRKLALKVREHSGAAKLKIFY